MCREDFKRAVLELRKNISLTGLPLDDVIQKVNETASFTVQCIYYNVGKRCYKRERDE